ncbi:MFS transporter [Geothrix fermentans]|uniref:MFS transporter n=1 Tax=Geothrix fermentans TaxID=44676 RepID=UPI000405DFE0|nr:MFS transporter [Geothrix fermentans]
MDARNGSPDAAGAYRGTDCLILGIVLAVITFWLFAQTTLNVAPAMRSELRISEGMSNLAVSITALFSGIFIVVAGGLADRLGRVRLTCAGLALSIAGSALIALSPAGTAAFLMAGRVIQGMSAACIMPATLALMKAYFEGRDRQRALSYWSIGSWGGSGLCALFGGLVASTLGWRWIFWMSILVAAAAFLKVETSGANSFVDLRLFDNRTYTGATLSNFLLNGAAGTLLVALSLVQQEAGLSSLQSGLMTTGYLVAILSTIRVGEKLLQRWGPRKPMLLGCWITTAGILLTTSTFLLARTYVATAFVGFTLFGIGLGLYATPSTDAALSNVPQDKAGSASGIYKMASSLGAAFGVALSAAIFTGLGRSEGLVPMAGLFMGRTDNLEARFAAGMALMFNAFMVLVAIVAILWTVPKREAAPSGL